jgi:hypothetical protein
MLHIDDQAGLPGVMRSSPSTEKEMGCQSNQVRGELASSGAWPTRAMRRRLVALASCVMTFWAVCPGAKASSTFTGGLPSMPAARMSAVCLARTNGLVKIFVHRRLQLAQACHAFSEAADAPLGQRPFPIVGPLGAPLGCDGVPD